MSCPYNSGALPQVLVSVNHHSDLRGLGYEDAKLTLAQIFEIMASGLGGASVPSFGFKNLLVLESLAMLVLFHVPPLRAQGGPELASFWDRA